MTKEKDPYMLDPSVGQALIDADKPKSASVLCPKHNLKVGKPCAVCTAVKALYDEGGPEKEKLASRLSAKVGYYAWIVFPSNPDKAILLEMGKKAGDAIKYGIRVKGWLDIVNPKAGVGRELKITKQRGDMGYNAYSVEPSLEKLTYDVGQKALDGRKNWDDIFTMIETEPIYKISSLKMDETITIMLLPDLDMTRKWPVCSVWRHWDVTQEEVDGKIPIQAVELLKQAIVPGSAPLPADLVDNLPDFQSPTNVQIPEAPEEIPEVTVKKKPDTVVHESCFRDADSFDIDDADVCQTCKDFIECGVACGEDREKLEAVIAEKGSPKKTKRARTD